MLIGYNYSLMGSITPTIRDDLHWLPVPQRIDYKLCTIIYRCLHQTALVYLQDMCVPVSTTASRRYLRSAASGDLQVLATKTVTFGTRSFASSAPKLCNSLPLPFRDSTLTLKTIRQPAENSFVQSSLWTRLVTAQAVRVARYKSTYNIHTYKTAKIPSITSTAWINKQFLLYPRPQR